ncbi:hypothetical protein POKO110462_21550 [Pontibacter korlensis]
MLLVVLFTSCTKKLDFNKFELSLLDVYKEGDTLIFQSSKGDLDTVYIVDKTISHAQWNPLAHSGKYTPLNGKIYYARKKLPNGQMNTRPFIHLYKNEPDSTSLYIFYNIFFSKKFRNDNPSELMSVMQDGTYMFRNTISKKDSDNQEVIYWNYKHGIIKYITPEGVIWTCLSCNYEE